MAKLTFPLKIVSMQEPKRKFLHIIIFIIVISHHLNALNVNALDIDQINEIPSCNTHLISN